MSESFNVDAAVNHYKSHKTAVKKYVETHRDKINEINRNSYHRMKDDPEKYELYKQRKRNTYKLKKELKKIEEIKEN